MLENRRQFLKGAGIGLLAFQVGGTVMLLSPAEATTPFSSSRNPANGRSIHAEAPTTIPTVVANNRRPAIGNAMCIRCCIWVSIGTPRSCLNSIDPGDRSHADSYCSILRSFKNSYTTGSFHDLRHIRGDDDHENGNSPQVHDILSRMERA